MIRFGAFVVAALLAAHMGYAKQIRNDLPSCRSSLFHEDPSASTKRDVLFVIDRTVTFPREILEDTVARASRALTGGDHVAVFTFSGLTASEFTLLRYEAYVDLPASDEDLQTRVPASHMAEAAACFTRQTALARRRVESQIRDALAAPLSDAQHSEIMKALTVISGEAIRKSTRPTVVVVISDMLEHSDLESFYSNHLLRTIDPAKAMQTASAHHLIGDFSKARVYVVGAAAGTPSGGQRGLRQRQSLETFWREWFAASNAEVAAWGEPALLQDIL